MVSKNKNRKIIPIIVFSVTLLLLVGVGIYWLTKSKKVRENKEKQVPFKEQGDKIEFLVKFHEIMNDTYYFFTKENTTKDRLIYVHKDNKAFLTTKPNSDSFYYLKILKNQKEQTFFEKSDFVELSRK